MCIRDRFKIVWPDQNTNRNTQQDDEAQTSFKEEKREIRSIKKSQLSDINKEKTNSSGLKPSAMFHITLLLASLYVPMLITNWITSNVLESSSYFKPNQTAYWVKLGISYSTLSIYIIQILYGLYTVSYTHLTLPTIYSV
eukprot:TRINITY_DN12184_c0_g1_i2.p1 TRINITY_DN12184_c0_g1~~TRINITY_DN12184_c0_g1_i2.p1  ORF type:complete len:140 (-),score=13.32 TRINITY_DN12184_c0_g1_i2:35-454(-)